ncbi:MAG: alpha/beta hydrolase [Deltaproteobacteria bacterium]
MPSPEFESVVEMLKAQPLLAGASFEEMRRGMEVLTSTLPLPEGVEVEAVSAGGVACEWVTAPRARSDRTLMYLHGGGYTLGSLDTHRNLAAGLSAAAGLRCLLVDYRLAPENPHPAALEDATAVYRWLLGQGNDPAGLAIGGDSAGGGLTAATLVALRDGGDVLPAAAVLLSPWVDLEGSGDSMVERAAVDPMVNAPVLNRMAEAYLGGLDLRTPLASPLYAELGGLPPLLIQVGTEETLYDDSTRFADKARQAGVEVDLEVWPEMIHVFQAFAPMVPEAREAVSKIGDFLKQRLDG